MAGLRRAERSVSEQKTFFYEKSSVFFTWGKIVSVSAVLLLVISVGILGVRGFRPGTEKPGGGISGINLENEDIFSEMLIRPDTVLSVISYPVSFRDDSGAKEGNLRNMVPCRETLRVLAEISGIFDEKSRKSPPREPVLENSEYREFLVKASEVVGESFRWILEPEGGGDEF